MAQKGFAVYHELASCLEKQILVTGYCHLPDVGHRGFEELGCL